MATKLGKRRVLQAIVGCVGFFSGVLTIAVFLWPSDEAADIHSILEQSTEVLDKMDALHQEMLSLKTEQRSFSSLVKDLSASQTSPGNTRSGEEAPIRFENENGGGDGLGLAASQARYMMLSARQQDLELQLQYITDARAKISNITESLATQVRSLKAGSAERAWLEQRMATIRAQDRVLHLEAQRIAAMSEANATEVEAVERVIQQQILSTNRRLPDRP